MSLYKQSALATDDGFLAEPEPEILPVPRYLNINVLRTEVSASTLQVEVLSGTRDIAALEQDWKQLESRTAHGHQCFQSFDWCHAWARVYCIDGGPEPFVITVYDRGELKLIWPLMLTCIGPICVARWLSEPFSQYGDVIADRDGNLNEYLAAAWNHMMESGKVSVLRLRHVREDASAYPFLKERCCGRDQSDYAPFLDLTAFADEPAYDARYTKVQRRRRKKIKKALSQFGEVRYERVAEPSRIEGLIKEALSQKRIWLAQRGQYSQPITDPKCERFLNLLAATGHSGLQLVASHTTAGERPVAYELSLRYRGHHLCFITAHDTQLTDLSPGRLHMDAAQRAAIKDGCRVFDLMVPGSAHKQSWSSDTVRTFDLNTAFDLKGRTFTQAYLKYARPALRSAYYNAPSAVKKALLPLMR